MPVGRSSANPGGYGRRLSLVTWLAVFFVAAMASTEAKDQLLKETTEFHGVLLTRQFIEEVVMLSNFSAGRIEPFDLGGVPGTPQLSEKIKAYLGSVSSSDYQNQVGFLFSRRLTTFLNFFSLTASVMKFIQNSATLAKIDPHSRSTSMMPIRSPLGQ